MTNPTGPRFGIMTAPMQVDYDDILRVWREADTIPEIEHAWLFDHLPIAGDLDGPILEGWTLLSALAQCGRLEGVADREPVARDLAATAGRGLPSAVGPVTVGIFVGHLFDGRLRDFDPVLVSLNDAAIQRAEDPYRGVWTFLLGRSAFAQGRLAQAIPRLREAAALLRLRDPGMILPWCLSKRSRGRGAP